VIAWVCLSLVGDIHVKEGAIESYKALTDGHRMEQIRVD
jgi:hypothetical protein